MDLVRGYKESKYLIFEFDNQSTVKYDLGTNEYIGKKGNVVKSLVSQFSGNSIADVIASFEDEKYRKFLELSYKKDNNDRYTYPYTSVGTFLSHIKQNSKLEQYVLCDINIDLGIRFKMSDIPKGLIKLVKEKDLILTNRIVENYNLNLNIFTYLFNREFDMFDVMDLITKDDWRWYEPYENICKLVKDYNYNLNSLCEYINNVTAFEGYAVREMIRDFEDYNRMMKSMTNKYEKYPHWLSSQHMITIRNYNRYKKEYSEEMFAKRIDVELEFEHKDYVIIYPKTAREIQEEGVNLSHCVGSYVDKVIAGTTNILFLRKKDEINKSLVTIEVKNGNILQRRGLYNRNTTEEENFILQKYKEKVLDKLLDKVS